MARKPLLLITLLAAPRSSLFPYTTLFRSMAEGNSGTTNFTFTVTLSAVSGQTVTVDYFTSDNTATAGSEYTDRKSTRLNSSHGYISYAVVCLKKKKTLAQHRVPTVHSPVL